MSLYDFVGVDVAKDKFDGAIQINNRYKHLVYSNDLKGHTEFATWLTQHTTAASHGKPKAWASSP